MDLGIFPWAPLQDAVSSAPRANVPIPRAPPSRAADPSATPISPIRMDPQRLSPIQMKALPVATILRVQSASPLPLHGHLLLHPLSVAPLPPVYHRHDLQPLFPRARLLYALFLSQIRPQIYPLFKAIMGGITITMTLPI